jgi:hypothetical protein
MNPAATRLSALTFDVAGIKGHSPPFVEYDNSRKIRTSWYKLIEAHRVHAYEAHFSTVSARGEISIGLIMNMKK